MRQNNLIGMNVLESVGSNLIIDLAEFVNNLLDAFDNIRLEVAVRDASREWSEMSRGERSFGRNRRTCARRG